MISLASIVPSMADILGEKPTTLIERQRALVRAGILKSLPGRGRGAGVIASPESVAILIISLLASTTLADAPDCTSALLKAGTLRECPLTGEMRFGNALASVLSSPAISARVDTVQAEQTHTMGQIHYGADRTVFVGKSVPGSQIFTSRWVKGDTIRKIAALLANEVLS